MTGPFFNPHKARRRAFCFRENRHGSRGQCDGLFQGFFWIGPHAIAPAHGSAALAGVRPERSNFFSESLKPYLTVGA